MNFDEETLQEIEDYINALDESVGLYVDTLTDIENAIKKQRKKLKNLTIPVVIESVCSCGKEMNCYGSTMICECGEMRIVKQTVL